jgi:Histidine kinase-, DNA gyrase B-, and HSP90-like ATPase
MTISPFPYISTIESPPQDGYIFRGPEFCKRNYNHKCRDYYSTIINKPGFYICPYGFASHVINLEDSFLNLTALNIEKLSLRKDVRKRIKKNEIYPRLGASEYEYIISCYKDSVLKGIGSFFPISKDYINDIFHELRKLNAELKTQSDYILKASEKYSSDSLMQKRAHNILSITQLMSIRLNTFDLNMNPELSFSGPKRKLIVYEKFDKIIRCLTLRTKKKNVFINKNGSSHAIIQALEVFELLPFLLIENAIKYSIENSEIDVTFSESRNKLKIEISNFGPPVKKTEIPKLLNRGFRGENARIFSAEGTGLGLHLASAISVAHDIDVNIFPNSEIIEEKGHQLAEFIVTLTIKT